MEQGLKSIGNIMQSGIVKWFNAGKGFGFITPDNGEKDIFAHYSGIVMEGFKNLKEGQKVQFVVTESPKGLQATEITPV
jgi:CspA family cold shock protein